MKHLRVFCGSRPLFYCLGAEEKMGWERQVHHRREAHHRRA